MRLIDLHVDWLLQYAGESTVFDPRRYPTSESSLTQAEGYLQATSAAVVSCYRDAEEWAGRPDAWAALGELIARIEAEFPGRLLIAASDFARWEDDPDGLAWGMIGVEGFDSLIRTEADLGRLPALFVRGVRLFQPTYTATGLLAGSSAPGDDRGLTDLGRGFLEVLATIAPDGPGPRPILDLAHLNPRTSGEILDWYEADPGRAGRVAPIYSHGTPAHPGFDGPRALPLEHLGRLRVLGGLVGISVSPPFFRSPDEVKAAIESAAALPFRGRPGFEGIGIGTDFLGVDATFPGLGNTPEIVAWAGANFDPASASALLHDNARALIARACGVDLPG